MDFDQYVYAALPQQDHIRLLTVEAAGEAEAPLLCSLISAPADGIIEYTALSYSWGMNGDGDATQNRSILLHGKTFPVTRNLYEGLIRLRASETMPLRIWIDAVCINQQDIAERNSQVGMMAAIYSNAKRTIIWLGENEHEQEAEELKWLIQSLANYDPQCVNDRWRMTRPMFVFMAQQGPEHVSWLNYALKRVVDGDGYGHYVKYKQHGGFLRGFEKLVEQDYFYDLLNRRTRIIIEFVSRRYWYRRWILQEISHSPSQNTWLHWGGMRLRFDVFFYGLVVLGEIFKWLNESWRRSHSGWAPMWVGSRGQIGDVLRVLSLRDRRSLDILELLGTFWQQGCKEPHDRLYALGALVELPVKVDYRIPAIEPFRSLAQAIVDDHNCGWLLDNLFLRDFSDSDPIVQHLHSWVPDFRGELVTHRERRLHAQSMDAVVLYDQTLYLGGYMIGTLVPLVDVPGQSHWVAQSKGMPVLWGRTRYKNTIPGDILVSLSPLGEHLDDRSDFMKLFIVREIDAPEHLVQNWTTQDEVYFEAMHCRIVDVSVYRHGLDVVTSDENTQRMSGPMFSTPLKPTPEDELRKVREVKILIQ